MSDPRGSLPPRDDLIERTLVWFRLLRREHGPEEADRIVAVQLADAMLERNRLAAKGRRRAPRAAPEPEGPEACPDCGGPTVLANGWGRWCERCLGKYHPYVSARENCLGFSSRPYRAERREE